MVRRATHAASACFRHGRVHGGNRGGAIGERTIPSECQVAGGRMALECTHLNQVKFTKTDKRVCEDCIKTGDTWVHLRMCLECGHVACCDSSKNKHATKHFRRTKHPLMRSIQ